MYGALPNTGMNLSTPIYLIIGLGVLALSGAAVLAEMVTTRRSRG